MVGMRDGGKKIDGLPSFDEFPAVSFAKWQALASAALKGASVERLTTQSHDGLKIEPLYSAAASYPLLLAKPEAWQISQRIDYLDVIDANTQALEDLENGASALHLVLRNGQSAHGFGVDWRNNSEFAQLFAGIELDLISLRVDPAGSGLADAKAIQAGLLHSQRIASAMRVDFGCDPIGAFSRGAVSLRDGLANVDELCQLASEVQDKWGGSRVFACDGRVAHSAGASEAQELGFVLGTAVYYLRAMTAHGVSLADARAQIAFTLAADADQFLTIAKFRALRILWARIEEACGLTPKPIQLFAQTAWRMMTRTDPWVNVLRVNMAMFGAAIGGADAIQALPFTQAIGLPDAFARRIARNAQSVLQLEAHLAVVSDAAAGSGAFEALTQGMCETAWAKFQATEARGGIVAALEHPLAQEIAQVSRERARAIATRREPLTGTSEFAFVGQPEVAVVTLASAEAPVNALLPAHRVSVPFEQLRARAAKIVPPPKVFLANLGILAEYGSRNSFAKPFFAAGGIASVEIEDNGPCDIARLTQLAETSGARVVCLCGSDAAYASQAVILTKALVAAGFQVFLAGRGGPMEEALKLAGIVRFIHVGSDVLAANSLVLDVCEH